MHECAERSFRKDSVAADLLLEERCDEIVLQVQDGCLAWFESWLWPRWEELRTPKHDFDPVQTTEQDFKTASGGNHDSHEVFVVDRVVCRLAH